MYASTAVAPRAAASQEDYFERAAEWAESGANWATMEESFMHRVNIAMSLMVLPFWLYHDDGENLIEFRLPTEYR